MKHSRICCALTGLSVLLSFVPAALAAEGDPCVEDADCGEGYECDLPPIMVGSSSSDATSSPGEGDDVPDFAGDAKVVPPEESGSGGAGSEVVRKGTCERAPETCTTDADCDEYYVCVADDVTVACDSDGSCADVDPEPQSGTCEAEPASCSKSSDCPSGTECVDGACTLDLTSCEKDSDCQEGYECLDVDARKCSAAPPCAGGSEGACESEPVCEPSEAATSFCFPNAKACSTDDDCSAGWRCYDMEDEEDAPGDWAGVDKGCLPPELVGAIEGYVYVTLDGVAMGSGETSASSDSGTASTAKGASDNDDDDDATTPTRGTTDTSDETGDSDPSGATGESASPSKSDGGCALSRPGPSRKSLAGMMAMVLLGAAALRRRAS